MTDDPHDPRSPDPDAVVAFIHEVVREGADPEVFGDRVPRAGNFVHLVQGLFLLARVREVHGSEALDRTLAALDRVALHHVAAAALNGWRSLSMPKDS